MRVLVCGVRDFRDKDLLFRTLDQRLCPEPTDDPATWMPRDGTVIIAGGASGADHLAVDWAVVNWVPFEEYPADWKAHGRAAGPIRNERMIREGKPDLVVAFAGGRGTADLVRRARASGLEVVEIRGETR